MALVSSFHGTHKLLPYAINWDGGGGGPGRKEANHFKLRRHNIWCLTLSTFNLKRDRAYECVCMCSTGRQSLQMCVYVFYKETELTNVCLCVLQGDRAYKCVSMCSTGRVNHSLPCESEKALIPPTEDSTTLGVLTAQGTSNPWVIVPLWQSLWHSAVMATPLLIVLQVSSRLNLIPRPHSCVIMVAWEWG